MSHLMTDIPTVERGAIVETITGRIRDLTKRYGRMPHDSNRPQTYRLTIAIDRISPLAWLARQHFARKVYWADRAGKWEMAGVGSAELITMNAPVNVAPLFKRLDYVLSEAPDGLRYYGGMRFDYRNRPQRESSPWRCTPDCMFILPRFELLNYRDSTAFSCNLLDSDLEVAQSEKIISELETFRFDVGALQPERATILRRTDAPGRDTWSATIDAALASLDGDTLKKIVLARESLLETEKPITPWPLLEQLRAAGDCYTFAFQFDPFLVFFGATPERLYSRKGVLIESEAQAGTRPRGSDNEHDASLSDELLHSEKDRREHQFVIDGIAGALTSAGISCRVDHEVTVRTTPRVQHLYTRILGRVPERNENDLAYDATLLSALHPTPAVAGLPSLAAMDRIAAAEPFDRGWYAGPVGWISPDRSEFAVGIRSALTRHSETRLYAGAGIVPGSRAEDEWQEIENKTSPIVRLLTDS